MANELQQYYLHYFEQKSNTGIKIDLLQKYLFVPLDIFQEIQHNKNIKIEGRLEAWLTFLCMDEPEAIIAVIEKYPDFRAMYEQIYDICNNIEEVMGMFSKELRELDRNTVQLMIDEMQEELNQEKRKAEQKDRELRLEIQKAEQERRKAEQDRQELEHTRQAYEKALARIAELEGKS